jgi:hypothetical protein
MAVARYSIRQITRFIPSPWLFRSQEIVDADPWNFTPRPATTPCICPMPWTSRVMNASNLMVFVVIASIGFSLCKFNCITKILN